MSEDGIGHARVVASPLPADCCPDSRSRPGDCPARLNAIGIPVGAARRAALTGLAAQLPAAVLADALGINPATAVNWAHDAGSNWNRYAAELARNRDHKRGVQHPGAHPTEEFSTRATRSLPV